MSVMVMGDRVAIVLPPGETVVFDAAEADALATALDQAATNTEVPH